MLIFVGNSQFPATRYDPAVGLGWATLAVSVALFRVPGPAVPRPEPPSPPSGQGVLCTADWVARLDQPISRTSSFGQFSSGGETGVISCRGTLRGHTVTGPGTYGVSGAFGPGPAGGADCTDGAGAGDFSATIPTDAGPQHVDGILSFYWAGPSGVVFDGRFPAAFRLSPGAGDCVSEPARELHFQVGGILFVDGGS
ncbi:MAG: hypothetical protein QOD57_1874 [Actinomycetota bacterium]|nr:hypothetical protein [Actinomycetota bacterium]